MVIETIIAAIITGGATLYANRKRKQAVQANIRAVEAESKVETVIKTSQDELFKRIGYMFDRSYVGLDILDQEGTCKVVRHWSGAKVIGDMRLPHLRSGIMMSTPGGTVFKSPTLVEEIEFPRPVRFKVESKVEGDVTRSTVLLEIEGGLTKEDPPLSYGYEYTVSKGFLMTREEVLEAYKDDFIKDEAFTLTEDVAHHLEIEITFPPKFNADVNWGVKLRGVDALHDGEYQRIKANRDKIARGYRFRADNPVMACNYYIHWWPPAKG